MLLKDKLREAFLAGFGMSGVSYNAEFPFSDKGKNIHTDPDLLDAFNVWYNTERTKKTNVPM